MIEVEGLRKEYHRLRGPSRPALAGLDLVVPGGGVFGFLGPNGSGKTTTIRCLLGLVRPSGGRCRLLGAETPSALPHVIGRVGAIVEAPALFPGFSGRRNLTLLARMDGIGAERVEAALAQVGLASRAGDAVRTYSLGMRQRLGIAAALLKDPDLLILDEPANGLDPAGIKEVRELLRRLGDEGRTVFVSSHILSEVQQICDTVAIIARGRTVAVGPVEEVLRSNRAARLSVRIADPDAGAAILREAGFTAQRQGDLVMVDASATDGERVTRTLAERGMFLSELRAEDVSLEDVFLALTGDSAPSPALTGDGPPPPAPTGDSAPSTALAGDGPPSPAPARPDQ